MPHYKNGRKVEIGDKFVATDNYGNVQAGTVVKINEGTKTCDLLYAPIGVSLQYQTAGDALHVDDVHDKLKEIKPPAPSELDAALTQEATPYANTAQS